MRKLPENLIQRQNLERQQTLDRIQKAIDELKSEGALINTKNLMDLTGFARSTFSKAHVKDLLRSNKVCKFKDRVVIAEAIHGSKAIEKLETDLNKANKQITKLSQELAREKEKNIKMKIDYSELNEQYQLLLGKWHILHKEAKIKGIKL